MSEDIKQEGTCRSCLSDTTELRSIFKPGRICGQITMLSDMLKDCTNLEFNEEDGLPGHICNKCVLHVSKAYAFKQQCIKANETLRLNLKIETDIIIEEDEEMYTDYIYDDEAIVEEIEPDSSENIYIKNEYEIIKSDKHSEILEISVANAEQIKDEAIIATKNKITVDEYVSVKNQETTNMNNIDPQSDNEEIVLIPVVDSEPESNEAQGFENHDEYVIPKMVYRKRAKRVKKKPPFKCEVCLKVLSNHNSYKYHMQLHSDNTPFLCSDCGQGFKTRNAYDGHMITHREVNPHTCEYCQKSYRQAASLRTHMLSHTGEKPFLCGICGKGMTQKSGFKKHMLTHTGEKPHQCDICAKLFRYSSNLIMHKRSHTGEKPYTCDICEKRFIGCEQLKRHKLIHSGEKPFACDFCGKCFNRRSTLHVHRNIHTGDKKYKCNICDKSYIQLHCLSTHLETHAKQNAI